MPPFSPPNNPPHTIKFPPQTYKLHLLPSPIFYKQKLPLIPNPLLLHPLPLLKQLHPLNQTPISTHNLPISNPPQLILPYHIKQHQYQQQPPPH
ncbi:adenylosuccinate synthetase, partial [Staphylococcus saprophyticus]|uniref:adenylosuccinate synthetase n=1 Tax=Staphylococcus saprophyticus TaxID=29385 RepID=UPI001642B0AD